jgi:phosphate starvation-inducible protein PhoH
MKNTKRPSRGDKSTQGPLTRAAKASQWEESYGIHKITLTASQKEFQNKILQNDMVICESPAGTGKSMTALYTFVKEYLRDTTKQIMVVRTPVEAGADKIGALPDNLNAKIEPHFASAKALLEMLLNKGKVETDMDHRIHFKIPNFCLGATFDNTLLVIDEVQQLPPLILKLMLERVGHNSKVVVLGDSSQLYTSAHGRNALRDCIPRFFDSSMQPKYPDISYHRFTIEDIQRSDFVKTVVRAYSD